MDATSGGSGPLQIPQNPIGGPTRSHKSPRRVGEVGVFWLASCPLKTFWQFFWGMLYPFFHMDVSENNGPPKSSILIGFSIINHPFGVPLFLETPILLGVFKGRGGKWGTLKTIRREDWGTLGKIRGFTTPSANMKGRPDERKLNLEVGKASNCWKLSFHLMDLSVNGSGTKIEWKETNIGDWTMILGGRVWKISILQYIFLSVNHI